MDFWPFALNNLLRTQFCVFWYQCESLNQDHVLVVFELSYLKVCPDLMRAFKVRTLQVGGLKTIKETQTDIEGKNPLKLPQISLRIDLTILGVQNLVYPESRKALIDSIGLQDMRIGLDNQTEEIWILSTDQWRKFWSSAFYIAFWVRMDFMTQSQAKIILKKEHIFA